MDICPCGTGLTYNKCCGPYIAGNAYAPTAEALMRSRYTAYVKGEIDYIVNTCVRDDDHNIDVEQTKRWSQKSRWQGLSILAIEKGAPSDSEGTIEFIASYSMDGLSDKHHERAKFKKTDGKWLYLEGEIIPATITRDSPKVGRNDPCPCGSGRKFKQCCGRAT